MAAAPLHPQMVMMNTRIEEQAWATAQDESAEDEGEILDDAEERAPESDFKPIEVRVAEEDPAKQLTD